MLFFFLFQLLEIVKVLGSVLLMAEALFWLVRGKRVTVLVFLFSYFCKVPRYSGVAGEGNLSQLCHLRCPAGESCPGVGTRIVKKAVLRNPTCVS